MTRVRTPLLALAAALALTSPAAALEPPAWPAGVDLSRGVDIDETYRNQFHLCDLGEAVRNTDVTYRRSCRGDPNLVAVLRRMSNGAIAYVSKLAIDFDGSPLACGDDPNPSDQCGTSLMLPTADGRRTPVNADRVPYVVIPRRDPDETHGQFGRLTGVRVGDFGVVVYRDRVVPVIVADTGPYDKLGEGSLALHRALGREPCATRDEQDTCLKAVEPQTSIERNVVTILFPGSARPDLTSATVEAVTRAEGLRLWAFYREGLVPARR